MTKKQLIITVCAGMIVCGLALGAGNIIQNIQNYYESPAAETSSGEETFGGTIAESWVNQGGLLTFVVGGEVPDATINLMSVLNPFDDGKATSTTDTTYNMTLFTTTSTVERIYVDVYGVSTSTMKIVCGGATSATAEPTYKLLDVTLPSSTKGYYRNDMNESALGARGLGSIGTGSSTGILLTHDYPYLNCVATGTSATAGHWGTGESRKGVTGDTNTFTAVIKAVITRIIR